MPVLPASAIMQMLAPRSACARCARVVAQLRAAAARECGGAALLRFITSAAQFYVTAVR